MTDKRNEPEIIDLDRKAADEIVQRVQASDLPEQDRRIICAIFASYLCVVQLLQLKRISIARLKKFVFGARTEKTEALLGNGAPTAAPAPAGADGPGADRAARAQTRPRVGERKALPPRAAEAPQRTRPQRRRRLPRRPAGSRCLIRRCRRATTVSNVAKARST
jgi:hypothetical protein